MTVWKREVEAPEVRDQGYLRLLQTRSPGETFRGEQSAFKAQGGEALQRRKAGVGFGGQGGGVILERPGGGEQDSKNRALEVRSRPYPLFHACFILLQ